MRPFAIACAVVTLLTGACSSGDDRPSLQAWEPVWTSTRDLVPGADGFLEGGEDLCGEVLGEVRARREELLPSPNESIDELIDRWVALVEGLSLDCPKDAAQTTERVELIDRLGDAINSATGDS